MNFQLSNVFFLHWFLSHITKDWHEYNQHCRLTTHKSPPRFQASHLSMLRSWTQVVLIPPFALARVCWRVAEIWLLFDFVFNPSGLNGSRKKGKGISAGGSVSENRRSHSPKDFAFEIPSKLKEGCVQSALWWSKQPPYSLEYFGCDHWRTFHISRPPLACISRLLSLVERCFEGSMLLALLCFKECCLSIGIKQSPFRSSVLAVN